MGVWWVTEDAGDHTYSSNSRVCCGLWGAQSPELFLCPNECELSISECQHHCSSPVSCHPIETILCLSAERTNSPGCFSGTGAQPQAPEWSSPRKTSQAQVGSSSGHWVPPTPTPAQGRGLERTLKGTNGDWLHAGFHPSSRNLSR